MRPMQRPSVKDPAAEHALRSGQNRRAAGERHRVPRPRSPGAAAHPVRQRPSRAPDGIRLRFSVVEDLPSSLPDSVRVILKLLVDTFTALEAQITALDAEIRQRSKSDPTARRLM